MKKYFFWFAKVILSGIISVALLSLFAFYYKYSGNVISNPTGSTDFTHLPYRILSIQDEGNAIVHLDENGFNNLAWEPDRPIDILLTGDSQVFGVHVMQQYSLGFLLNQGMVDKYTYNIGMASHTIYTGVKNMDNALREYAPLEYILIDTQQLNLDASSMQGVVDGTYMSLIETFDLPIYDQIDKWISQHTALYFPGLNLMKDQSRKWISSFFSSDAKTKSDILSMTDYTNLLDEFLGKAAQAASDHGVKLIILYIPKTEILPDGDIHYFTDSDYLEIFTEVCEQNNIIFVDMTEAFERLCSEQHRLPYGFANTEAGEGHLNKYGYHVIAEDLVKIMKEIE